MEMFDFTKEFVKMFWIFESNDENESNSYPPVFIDKKESNSYPPTSIDKRESKSYHLASSNKRELNFY